MENIVAFLDVSQFQTPYDGLFTFHYIIVFLEELRDHNRYLKVKINPIQKSSFLSFLKYAEKLHKKTSTVNYLKDLTISIKEFDSSYIYISLEPEAEMNLNNILWSPNSF